MNKNTFIIVLSLIIAVSAYISMQANHQPPVMGVTVATALVCVIWWIFEPVPIPVTSLLPLAIFQITGILSKDQIGAAYGNAIILLLLGGFILSKAMESSGAHKRLAIYMIRLFGQHSGQKLVWGFMCTAALLSMWISNTATTLMLLPVALAVIQNSEDKKLAAPLMLGIAWAASIGGIGTPIGTPPNLVFMQVYEESIGKSISFLDWMKIAIPVVLIMLPIAAFVLTKNIKEVGHYYLPEVSKWTQYEKRVITIFFITAFFWMTRKEPFGGWSIWFGFPEANDASVALIAVIFMFLIPSGEKDNEGRNKKLLDWNTASDIPWGTLLLFGGGLCLAKAFVVSGLSIIIGENFSLLTQLPVLLMMLFLSLTVTFLTETTSNTASSVLLMPILASVALASAIDPKLLMIPAVMSASCAFMLPVATAPNSIAYSTNTFNTRYMARKGLVLNLLGAGVVALYCFIKFGLWSIEWGV